MNIQVYNPTLDLTQSILWQYDESVRLKSLIMQKQTWYELDQTDFWNNWVRDVFTLSTANDFGLSVWSIILGLPLVTGVAPDATDKWNWGFGLNTNDLRNFSNGEYLGFNGNFGSGKIGLTTEEKRMLLWLRYFYLTTRGDIIDINKFFKFLFYDTFNFGKAWVIDNNDMTMVFVFEGFEFSRQVSYFLSVFNLLPRAASVGYTIDYIDIEFNLLDGGLFKLLDTTNFLLLI